MTALLHLSTDATLQPALSGFVGHAIHGISPRRPTADAGEPSAHTSKACSIRPSCACADTVYESIVAVSGSQATCRKALVASAASAQPAHEQMQAAGAQPSPKVRRSAWKSVLKGSPPFPSPDHTDNHSRPGNVHRTIAHHWFRSGRRLGVCTWVRVCKCVSACRRCVEWRVVLTADLEEPLVGAALEQLLRQV